MRHNGKEQMAARMTLLTIFAAMSFALTPISSAQPCGPRWVPEQFGLPGINGWVMALAVLPEGGVVAAGNFNGAGGVSAANIALWNGYSWGTLAWGVGGPSWSNVRALAVLPNGHLIAGGHFATAGGNATNSIARWTGSGWTTLGSGVSGTNPFVIALSVLPNGDLLVGGEFTSAGGVYGTRGIARWDGSSWSAIGAGISGWVWALAALPNGDVIAAGGFDSASGVAAQNIARWNGTTWAPLGSGLNSYVRSIAVLPNGDIVAGGDFSVAGGVPANNVARWDGVNWSPLGEGTKNSVFALAVLPNGDLVAGGTFTTGSSGSAGDYISRWDGVSWAPIGSGLNSTCRALAVLPNGDLIAGGDFTSAGGALAARVARWTDSGVPWVSQQPNTQQLNQGQSTTLTASLVPGWSFVGPKTFAWQRNGQPVSDGLEGASEGGGNVSGAAGTLSDLDTSVILTITAAQLSDSGSYTVIFTSPCGSVTSEPATVTVSPPCPSDFDGSGWVDADDFIMYAEHFSFGCVGSGEDSAGLNANCTKTADFDHSGFIDSDDFIFFVLTFEGGC